MHRHLATLMLVFSLALGCDIKPDQAPVGMIGEPCLPDLTCDDGLVCVTGDSEDLSVCAEPARAEPCEQIMIDGAVGRVVDGGCVASCVQFSDDCGDGYSCEPVDALAVGFCAPT